MEFEQLIKLVEKVSESELTGLDYEKDGVKLHLVKEKKEVAVAAAPVQTTVVMPQANAEETAVNVQTPAEVEEPVMSGKIVKSPLVGTFYAAPAEDADPFVVVGTNVKKGQPLAIIEAMKLMNEIESEYDGTITEILIENGQPVEFGQPLFRIG